MDLPRVRVSGIGFHPEEAADPKLNKRIQKLWELGRRFIILTGPPGTGKSRAAEDYIHLTAKQLSPSASADHFRLSKLFPEFKSNVYSDLDIRSKLKEEKARYVWDFTVLHPQYTYEDLIRGFRMDADESASSLVVREGILGFMARVVGVLQEMHGTHQKAPRGILVMDEINRAPIGQIFGEALFAIDRRGESTTTPYELEGKGSSFMMPESLLLLGTMNSVDRATAGFDFALRRRITSVTVSPRIEPIRERLQKLEGAAQEIAETLYGRLERLILNESNSMGTVPQSELVIGHAYFLPPANITTKDGVIEWLASSYLYKILPVLVDYSEQGLLTYNPPEDWPLYLDKLTEGDTRLSDIKESEVLKWIKGLATDSADAPNEAGTGGANLADET